MVQPSATTYAAYWKRSLALAVDLLLYAALGWLVLWIYSSLIALGESSACATDTVTEILQWGLAGIVFFIGLFIYFCAFELSSWHATPGKKLMGLKVQDEKHKQPTVLQTLTRNLCKLLSFFGFFQGLWPDVNAKQKQFFHDELAHCVVIDKN